MPFEKGKSGNVGGRPVGAKSQKTLEWEALGDSITSLQSGNFNAYLNELWNGNKTDKTTAADLFLKALEYFKPKQARTEIKQEGVAEVTIRVIEGNE
jgi:hypothetical protein